MKSVDENNRKLPVQSNSKSQSINDGEEKNVSRNESLQQIKELQETNKYLTQQIEEHCKQYELLQNKANKYLLQIGTLKYAHTVLFEENKSLKTQTKTAIQQSLHVYSDRERLKEQIGYISLVSKQSVQTLQNKISGINAVNAEYQLLQQQSNIMLQQHDMKSNIIINNLKQNIKTIRNELIELKYAQKLDVNYVRKLKFNQRKLQQKYNIINIKYNKINQKNINLTNKNQHLLRKLKKKENLIKRLGKEYIINKFNDPGLLRMKFKYVYRTWNWLQVYQWIITVKNGRFQKYENKLIVRLRKHNITGNDLQTMLTKQNDLSIIGISDSIDRFLLFGEIQKLVKPN